jgi:hypothetical protein
MKERWPMIYLNASAYQYEGVIVYPDYHDPLQFYYLPNRPHLAVDEHNRPAIRFLVYREALDELDVDQDEVAGFLFFDTSLAWPLETLQKVAKRLQDDLELDMLPRLVPLLYRSGTVRLSFLDRQTVPDSQGPDNGPPDGEPEPSVEWVTFLESSGIPSLYGENRAIFNAKLTKKATALLFGAFEGFVPAGVVYELNFVGMQRAFNVKVTADWEQVYTAIQDKTTVSLIFFSSDIEKIVEEFIEKKIIKIEASLEGVGEEAMESEFKEVRKELTDFVIEKFFKPQPNPLKPEAREVVDGIVDAARRMRDLGSPLHVGYTHRELSVTEIRTFNADYTMTRAVERVIAPQAHLSLFFEDYSLTRDDIVTVVEGDDDMWRAVEFNIQANADFQGDGLFGVKVDVAYERPENGNEPGEDTIVWPFLLRDTNTVVKKRAWYKPNIGSTFLYRYNPIFMAGGLPGPVMEMNSGWREGSGNLVIATPTDLYARRRIEFQLLKNFPFDIYQQVMVHLRYNDLLNGWSHEGSTSLSAEKTHDEFVFRRGIDSPAEVEFRLSYYQGGDTVETDWQSTTDNLVLVDDPRELFPVRILIAGDRKKIQEMMLDFRYEDPENGVFETWSTRFTQADINEPKEWRLALADKSRHRYWYTQTIIDVDGNLITTGWTQDERNTLPVGMVYAKKWEVQPELVGSDFFDHGVSQVKLKLQYIDDVNTYRSDKEMTFGQPGKGETWALELRDPSIREYTYEVSYMLLSGFEKKIGPLVGTDTFLIISSVPPQS